MTTTTSKPSTKDAVLFYLVTEGVEVSADELSQDIGRSVGSIRTALKALVAEGKVTKMEGWFQAPATFFAADEVAK